MKNFSISSGKSAALSVLEDLGGYNGTSQGTSI